MNNDCLRIRRILEDVFYAGRWSGAHEADERARRDHAVTAQLRELQEFLDIKWDRYANIAEVRGVALSKKETQ